MKVYTWNIPEIYHFPIYDRYMSGIFHTYDTIQIPDDWDVAILGGKTQSAVPTGITLAAMVRPEEVERLARGARNPRHSAVQVP